MILTPPTPLGGSLPPTPRPRPTPTTASITTTTFTATPPIGTTITLAKPRRHRHPDRAGHDIRRRRLCQPAIPIRDRLQGRQCERHRLGRLPDFPSQHGKPGGALRGKGSRTPRPFPPQFRQYSGIGHLHLRYRIAIGNHCLHAVRDVSSSSTANLVCWTAQGLNGNAYIYTGRYTRSTAASQGGFNYDTVWVFERRLGFHSQFHGQCHRLRQCAGDFRQFWRRRLGG